MGAFFLSFLYGTVGRREVTAGQEILFRLSVEDERNSPLPLKRSYIHDPPVFPLRVVSHAKTLLPFSAYSTKAMV